MEDIWDLLILYFFSEEKDKFNGSTREDLFQESFLNTDRLPSSPTMLRLQRWGQRGLAALAPLLLPSCLCVTLSISLALPCAAILYFSFTTVPQSRLPLKYFCMCV